MSCSFKLKFFSGSSGIGIGMIVLGNTARQIGRLYIP